MFSRSPKYFSGDQIKTNKFGDVCSTYGGGVPAGLIVVNLRETLTVQSLDSDLNLIKGKFISKLREMKSDGLLVYGFLHLANIFIIHTYEISLILLLGWFVCKRHSTLNIKRAKTSVDIVRIMFR